MSKPRFLGRVKQGIDETIYYTVTTTNWGSSPSGVEVVAYDVTDDTSWSDVSDTVLSGSASASGDIITLPALSSLTDEHRYRIEVQFTAGGNTLEAYFLVVAEK